MNSPYLYIDPIEKIERGLRDIIHDALYKKYGADWIINPEVGLGGIWVSKLRKKESEDKSAQRDQTLCNLLLAYAEFSDLGHIIEKHKIIFDKIFIDWERFLEFYKTARDFRNTLKHHRDISPTQHALLIGISGEIERYINFWKIGVQLDIKKKILHFTDFISIKGISNDQILIKATNCIKEWEQLFIEALKKNSLDINKLTIIEKNNFLLKMKGHHIELTVETNPKTISNQNLDGIDYKGVHAQLHYSSGCKIDLNDFLKVLGKKYYHLAYIMSGNIDIDKLYEWASNQAGLTPSNQVSNGIKRYSIEYSFFKGLVRIGTSKGSEELGGDQIFITHNHPIKNWHPHTAINPEHLFGFMLGNSSPKAMINILQLSEI